MTEERRKRVRNEDAVYVDGCSIDENNAAAMGVDARFVTAPRNGFRQFRASMEPMEYSSGARSVNLFIGTHEGIYSRQIILRLRRDQLHTLGQAIEGFEQAEAARDDG